MIKPQFKYKYLFKKITKFREQFVPSSVAPGAVEPLKMGQIAPEN